MFHTGLHDDYHRPSDDVERLDSAGMSRVGRLPFELVWLLADGPERLATRSEAASETETMRRRLEARTPSLPDRLGVSWKPRSAAAPAAAAGDSAGEPPSDAAEGIVLSKVCPGSPAQRAGLRAGDRVIRFAGRAIHRGDDLIGAVRTATGPATATVLRDGAEEPIELSCALEGEPNPLGLLWRSDAAEPGAAIVTLVIPGTPAAASSLRAGDRIYGLDGRRFADEDDATNRLRAATGRIELEGEREGRIATVRLDLPERVPEDAQPAGPPANGAARPAASFGAAPSP